jgi:hypothetical protein
MARRMKHLLRSIAKPIDRFIDEVVAVKENRDISNAVGDQLNQIKKIVVLETETTDTEDLRAEIESEIVINNGEGEFESVCLVVEKLFDPVDYRIGELENANTRLHLTGGSVTHEKFLKFKQVLSGGVKVFATESTDVPFVFAGGNGKGFGSLYAPPGTGGVFSKLVI